MKFFLEFVSCCGTACRSNSVIAAEDRKAVSLYAGTVPVVESCSRRKHRRTTTTVSRSGSINSYGHDQYWRPALNAISEDRVLVSVVVDVVDWELENRGAANYGSDRLGEKQKVANRNRSPSKIQAPPHHSFDDFMIRRSAPFGATVPIFSPTPFFF